MPQQHRNFSYLDRGFYSEQIRRIWRFFPPDQTFFIKYDDFRNSLLPTMNELAKFLDIKPFAELMHLEINSNKYIDVISHEDWLYLKDVFYFEIKQVEFMLKWDCSDWLER